MRHPGRLLHFLSAVALAILLAGCGASPRQTSAPEATPEEMPAEGAPEQEAPEDTPWPVTPHPRSLAAPPRSAGEHATPSAGQGVAGGSAEIPPQATLIKVYFATDRLAASGITTVSHRFGSEWNKANDHLTAGVVTVSIPPVHQEGKVERPFHLWSYEFREDPAKHVVLTQLDLLKGDNFYGALRDEFRARDEAERDALVFIHGFNVVFDDAAYRTAQVSFDVGFPGVPMMYSWPSQGKLRAYDGDEETTDWVRRICRLFSSGSRANRARNASTSSRTAWAIACSRRR